MAAIGTGWVDGAWIEAGWDAGAWDDSVVVVLGGVRNVTGEFTTGGSVTITLYHPVTGSVISLISNSCPELLSTGLYVWHTGKLTTLPELYQEYLYVMTDGVTSEKGIIIIDPKLTDIWERLDLDATKPNTYANDGSNIVGTDFTLTKTDNLNGTSTVQKS